jgi:hypothetical protein
MGRTYLKGSTQFWILVVCSSAVSLLMIKEIFLSHAIIDKQHVLVDSRETADSDSAYGNAWQKLALRVWKAGQQDPAMTALLKSEDVTVREGLPPGATPPSTNPAPANPTPSTSSKPPQAMHPANP